MIVTRRTIDTICAKIAKGGIQAEVDLLLQGFTRAQIADIRKQVELRLRIGSIGGCLMEIDGVPVWGCGGWYIYPIDWSKVEDERFRTGLLTGRKKELHDLSRRISVNCWSRTKRRFLELEELMEEIAVAKELMAEGK